MILSPRSGQVADARKLLQRKHRTATGRFLAEGPQAVREAIDAGVVDKVFAESSFLASGRAAGLRIPRSVTVLEVEADALSVLTETVTPQGIVAVCRWAQPGLQDFLAEPHGLLVMMHAAADPGNAGAIIRAADAAGASGVLLTSGSVDATNGKCVRASAGSVFHLPIVNAGDTAGAVQSLHAAGYRVLAADVTRDAVDLFEAEGRGLLARGKGRTGVVWLMGNEAHGLPAELLELVDAVVRIPIFGRAESLNLAMAAGIVLYASARAAR